MGDNPREGRQTEDNRRQTQINSQTAAIKPATKRKASDEFSQAELASKIMKVNQ